MREVSLSELQTAREHREKAQELLLIQYGEPVLSFSMDIPNPVKDSPLIRRCFDAGLAELKTALWLAGIKILSPTVTYAITGCEFLCAVDANAERVRTICRQIVDGSPMGSLFVMNVLDPN